LEFTISHLHTGDLNLDLFNVNIILKNFKKLQVTLKLFLFFQLIIKNKSIFIDLLLLFIPRLTLKFLEQNNDLNIKIELIKSLMDMRENEVSSFKDFLHDMNNIMSFFNRFGITKFGNSLKLIRNPIYS